MGWRERRAAAEVLGDHVARAGHPKLTDAERLVALEVIDQCHEQTGLAFGSSLLPRMAERCGMDEKRFRRVLGQLAQKGLEMRVQVGTGKTGSAVFAHRGRQTTYRLPAFIDQATDQKGHADVPLSETPVAPKGPPPRTPSGEKGVRPGSERGTGASRKGNAGVPPTSVVPLSTELASSAKLNGDKADMVLARHGIPLTDRPSLERFLREVRKATSPAGLMVVLDEQGRFAAMVPDWRTWAEPTPQPPHINGTATVVGCDHCDRGWVEQPDGRLARCPACHPQPVNGHHR